MTRKPIENHVNTPKKQKVASHFPNKSKNKKPFFDTATSNTTAKSDQ
jgi:hypothetical protein